MLLTGGSLALAFGGRVVTALGGDSAPSKVKSTFAQMTRPPYPLDGAPPLPKDYLPGKIVPGSQRRVLTVRTSRGKVAALYVARTTRGAECIVAVGGPFGTGGCTGVTPDKGAFSALTVGGVSPTGTGKVPRDVVRWILGRATSPLAVSVRIAYADGTHHDIPLVEGWFMFALPAAHAKLSAAPERIDALAADGAHLGGKADPSICTLRSCTSRPRFPRA